MKAILGLVLLIFTVDASAAPALVWCQGCSPQQQTNSALAIGVLGSVYVGDAVNRTVNAYNVYTDVDDSTNPPKRVRVADSVAPDQQLVTGLNNAIKFYNTVPVGWKKRFNSQVDASKWPSIYNIINAGPKQNQFVNWVNGYSVIAADTMSLFGNVVQVLANFHIVDQSAGPTLTTTLTFSDGSHVDATFDPTTDKLRLDPATAQDSHDNNVPYLGTDGLVHNLGGEHDFDPTHGSSTDKSNFLNQVHALGVTIITAPSGSGSGGTQHGWICTYDEDTQIYTCWSS